MTTYNITHSEDIDGMLSYGILKTKYPDVIVIPTAHSSIEQDVDLSIFKKGDVIFITDFCLDIESMRYLSELCKVVWIDHHISAITKMEEAKIDLYSKMTDISVSACGLVWKFCYPTMPMPLGVEYCTKYDAWTHNGNKMKLKLIFYFISLHLYIKTEQEYQKQNLASKPLKKVKQHYNI